MNQDKHSSGEVKNAPGRIIEASNIQELSQSYLY